MTVTTAILPHGSDPTSLQGFESESAVAPSILTVASDRAAARNNEL